MWLVEPFASVMPQGTPQLGRSDLRTRTMRLLVAPDAELPGLLGGLDSESCWPEILNLCERWRVLPTLAARLASFRHLLPAIQAARLRHAVLEQMVNSSRQLRAATAVHQALQDAGITVAAFKGVAVLALLHAGGAGRSIGDIDLLVTPEEATRAIELLQARGFRPKIGPIPPAEYVSFIRNSPGSAGNEAISLVDLTGIDIDLHWKLGGFDAQHLLARSRQMPVAGGTLRVVGPLDGLCLTAHHALRNDLVPDAIARDLIDTQGWLRLLGNAAVDVDGPAGIPAAIETLRCILVQLGATEAAETGPAASTAARRLAELYTHQLAHGPINTDLAYLFSGLAAQKIVRGLWRSRHRYRVLMQAFERVNGEPSTTLLQRMLRLWASLLQSPPARLWQVRTLSRLKEDLA